MRKAILKIFASLVILGALGAALWFNLEHFALNPVETSLGFEYPSFVAADDQGRSYLIDRSLKRVSLVKASGELGWSIPGGRRDLGTFYFADEVFGDADGYLYLINRIPDAPGFYTVATEIIRYSPKGTFDRVIYRKDYPESERIPTLVQRGQLHSLRVIAGTVSWFDSSTQGLIYHAVPRDGGTVSALLVDESRADLLIPSATRLPDGTFVWTTKRGSIEALDSDGFRHSLYDAGSGLGPDGEASTPWKIQSDSKGTLFFTDLARGSIRSLDKDGKLGERVSEKLLKAQGDADISQSIYYAVSASPAGLVGTCGDFGPLLAGPGGKIRTDLGVARLPLALVALRWALWLALVLAALVFFFGLRVLYVDVLKRQVPNFAKTVAGLLVLTAAVGLLVASMILSNFSQRYSTEVLSKITQLVHLVPRLIDTDKLLAVSSPRDFGNSDYLSIRESIIDVIYADKSLKNEGLYFAIHRAHEGSLSTFMYLNGEPTIKHPFGYLNDPAGPYQASLAGQTQAQYSLDAWGSWMYATGPIKAPDGSIVGVFEMGGDLYSFTQENNRLIESLLVNILTILVLMILLLVEGTFLQEQSRKRLLQAELAAKGLTPSRPDDIFRPLFLVRPLAVLFFTSASMSLLFLPLVTKQFSEGFFGLPAEVVLGLPVSVRLAFFGVGTIMAGAFSSRAGWRSIFVLGLVLSAAGLGGAALSPNLAVFLLASVFIGLGAGFATIGMRSLINHEADDTVKADGFSNFYAGIVAGTNVGVIVGSWLADYIGYSNVFWLSLILTVATFFAFLRLFPGPIKTPPLSARNISTAKAIGLFFGNFQVFSYVLLIVLPVYFASMFLYYLMPVFAANQGSSNADIGRIFLLNGMVIIYLVPMFCGLLIRSLGARRSVYLSTFFWILGLVPFILSVNLVGLIISVLVMGIAEGTAAVAQNEYLLQLDATKKIGLDRAAGFFEVVGKIGETIAPIMIGFALLLGVQRGMVLIAGVMFIALLLFMLTNGNKKGNS